MTINADGEILGRLATKIAIILRGKDKPTFRPNLLCGDKVIVHNIQKLKVTGKKTKIYYRHSGVLGNLKSQTLKDLLKKDPGEVLRKAVYGMLPKNKLRKDWMKNLTIEKEKNNEKIA
ncbi:MAG: 50S ribosomal protein L13 [Patescibacteria group bacterium]